MYRFFGAKFRNIQKYLLFLHFKTYVNVATNKLNISTWVNNINALNIIIVRRRDEVCGHIPLSRQDEPI